MTDKSLEDRLHQWWLSVADSTGEDGQLLHDAAEELRRLRYVADGLQMANESLRREVERLREASDVARAADKLRCAEDEIRRLLGELVEYKRFTYELRDHCAELDDERRIVRRQLKAAAEGRESAEKSIDELESQLHRDERPVRMQLREVEARLESAEALLRDHLSELPDGGWVAAEEYFARYEQKETT